MVTLAQAQNLTQDKLSSSVINEFRKDPLMEMLPYDNCVSLNGGSTLNYVYNRTKTLASAGFRAIGTGEYTAQESDTEQITVALKAFGGAFKIDRVIQSDVKGVTNQVALQLQRKIEATKALFSDTFINGDSGTEEIAFDGIEKAVTGSSTEQIPGAALDLSTSALITANGNAFMDILDKMLSGMSRTPNVILMNRMLLAIMSGIARRSGYFSTSDMDAFGKPVTKYQGIPLIALGDKPGSANPIIGISAAEGSVGETSLYSVCFGEDETIAITPNGSNIITTYAPDFTTAGAIKTGEVEMVAAVAVKATRSIAALRKIKIS